MALFYFRDGADHPVVGSAAGAGRAPGWVANLASVPRQKI